MSKIQSVIFFIFQCYSLAIGITAIRIDFRRRRILESRLLSIYSACMNAALLVSIPFAVQTSLSFTSSLSHNSLLQMTHSAYITVHFGVILVMMGYRWSRERNSVAIARELFALDRCYFDRVPTPGDTERYFDLLLLGKACPTAVQIFSSLSCMLAQKFSLLTLLMTLYYFNTYYMVHSVVFQFYASLWQACKRLQLLNLRLSRMLGNLEALQMAGELVGAGREHALRSATAELRTMSRVHWRLTQLVQRLSDKYIYQTLAVLLIYCIHNITSGYYAVLMLNETTKTALQRWSFIFTMLSYLILFADIYLFYRMCGITAYAHQNTADILKEFRALPSMSASYERCCERFSLQLLQHKLTISMGGMFDLNMKAFLLLLTFIMQYSIILVQFDFETCLRKMRSLA